jgi:RNA polymerase-binding transcription factor DksA
VKKPAPRKATVRKAVKKAAKKAAPARKPAKKPAPKKAPRKAAKKAVKSPAKKPVRKAPAKAVVKSAPVRKMAPASGKARAFRKEELAQFRAMLQKQLELVQGNLNALAGDNLKRSPLDSTGDISSHSTHMADHGTDNFDRELALSLASSRQDSIYEIEDAIRRIDEGEYGTCQSCGKPVERPRLKALPFAKKCVACQSAAERGRSRFQPFTGAGNLQTLVTDDTVDLTDS